MRAFLFVLLVALAASKKVYKTAGHPVSDKLNVHLVAHTHDDVGWLKTVDQYYMGANNSIQHAGVQYILDSVLLALEANPDRKFIYVEQAFFQRWWREVTPDVQARMKALFQSGQFTFVNGGWCMHDEAAAHAIDMIDQTTVGHAYLKQEFGAIPTIGWQIDPFGHSATQAALLSAEVGFDSLWFMRLDWQDRNTRLADKTMQFMWRPSPSLGASAQVLTGAFITGYGPPDGFCYDISCSDVPIQDDSRLSDYNVQFLVDLFVNRSLTDAQYSATNNVMFLMGSDFNHENSNTWFTNLDKLIHYVNLDGRVNVFYSTPAIFTQALNAANATWTVKTDDFFPYADDAASYWTGYFTSRPALKRYIRVGSAFLNSARQLDAVTARNPVALQYFSEVMGVVQHHDAVSGTAKQHTTFDYAARIAVGYAAGANVTNIAMAALTQATSGAAATFSQCEYANISICDATATLPFVVSAYNALPRSTAHVLRIPISTVDANLIVLGPTGQAVPFQTVPSAAYDVSQGGQPYNLIIPASLPALGFAAFSVSAKAPELRTFIPRSMLRSKVVDPTVTIANSFTSLTFSASTGLLTTMSNLATGQVLNVSQNFYWYNSTACGQGWGLQDGSGQNSGAYIFRPNRTEPYPVATGAVNITVLHGALVSEVTQVFSNWLTQTVRLYANQSFAEFEWTVGPIPIQDALGKEIITRFQTSIASAGYVYTDSNGREMQERLLNYRPSWKLNVTQPVAGNYYPVASTAFIRDSTNQLTVLTDRAQGAASLASGELELMVHRRLLFDDSRGVGEPLNETASIGPYEPATRDDDDDQVDDDFLPMHYGAGLVVKGVHRVLLSPTAAAAKAFRPAMDALYFPALQNYVANAPAAWLSQHVTSGSSMLPGSDLPINVHIQTLQSLSANSLLLRLAHQFGVDEDPVLSAPATVSITQLFASFKIAAIQELSLTANQPVASMRKQRMRWTTVAADGGTEVVQPDLDPEVTLDASSVTLGPLQIRTFELTLA